jgi:hypothetical protein
VGGGDCQRRKSNVIVLKSQILTRVISQMVDMFALDVVYFSVVTRYVIGNRRSENPEAIISL